MKNISISPEQIIADLNWIINCPGLLQQGLLNDYQLSALSQQHIDRIYQLGEIELPSTKLGFYFEALIKRYIEVTEEFTLKTSNLQVQENKQTKGEFDLILEDKYNQFYHWEVSIKFYLCHTPELGFKGCCGTQLRDVFETKVSKLKHQQQIGRAHV